MTHLIGIDFGTTKTLVACFNHETKQAELIRLGRGIDKIPTAVYYDQKGRFLFGEDADDQMVFGAVRYKRGFKLELGSNVPSLLIDRNTRFRAVDLTCEFFKYIKGRCEEEVFNGEKVTKVFITMPVSFSPAQQKELKQAALNAGFLNVTLLTEPEAAGRAFFHINPANDLKSVMVVDWGGGTVDIAVVSRDGDAISVDANSSWGNDKLGGEAFDELLWDHVTDKIMKTDSRNRNPAKEPLEIINKMFKQVRSCKERLSKESAAKIIFSGSMGPYFENVTQAEFEDLIRHSVEDIGNKVKELLQKIRQRGGIYPEALLLIGGSSSIPLIRQVLAEKSGLKCLSWQYAHEAVAMGAAISVGEPAKTAAGTSTKSLGQFNESFSFEIPIQFSARQKLVSQFNESLGFKIPRAAFSPLEMIKVKAGTFMMGSPQSEEGRLDNEKHCLQEIKNDFWIGKFPITISQYRFFLGTNHYNWSYWPYSVPDLTNIPVASVSWQSAKEFC